MAGPTSTGRSPAGERDVPDALSAYLGRISRGELLTHREEMEFGRRPVAGDRLARRTLIEKNLRPVVSVAVKYRRSGVPRRAKYRLETLNRAQAELGISRQGVSQLQQRFVRRLKAG